jgi:hypothetical protein
MWMEMEQFGSRNAASWLLLFALSWTSCDASVAVYVLVVIFIHHSPQVFTAWACPSHVRAAPFVLRLVATACLELALAVTLGSLHTC